MPAISFFGYYFAMKKAEEKEQLNQYKAAAFTAWRIETTLSEIVNAMVKEKVKQPEFEDYLDANNLLTPYESKRWKGIKKLRKRMEEREARKKHDFANVIMLADKKRQQSLQESGRGKGET